MTQLRALRRRLPDDDELVASFLERYPLPTTKRKYRGDLARLRRFLEPRGVELAEATRSDLEAWVAELSTSGLADNTVSSAVRVASSFYTWAEDLEVVARSPLKGVRRPKAPSTSSTLGLDATECQRLLETAMESGWRDRLLICLMMLNGRRCSEVVGARVEHLDVTRGHRVLRVRQKGGDWLWTVLAPPTVSAVDAYLADRGSPRRGPLVGHLRNPEKPLTAAGASAALHRLAQDAGIARRVHPHALRHTFITLSLDAGVPLRDVQDAAGHASPVTTRRYDRARHSMDRAATYRLADYLALGDGGRQLSLEEAGDPDDA